MLATEYSAGLRRAEQLEVRIVRDRALVREAQRLRLRVQAEEWSRAGAPAAGSELDEDRFDIHCEHLVVRDVAEERVVATCRLLPPDAARRAGGCAIDEHFDMQMLEALRQRMVEVGRISFHPAYRDRNVSGLAWSALAQYLIDRRLDYLIGTASAGMADGGHAAASIHRLASALASSPEDLRAYPRREMPLGRLRDALPVNLPPILRGYLAMGAWICGEPALDRCFERAHIPVLLPLSRMRGRAARNFLALAA